MLLLAPIVLTVLAVPASAQNSAPVFNPVTVTRSVAENAPAGQNIGDPVAATDTDSSDTLTYSLGGTDAAFFDIVSTSGQIRTKAGVTYNHQAKSFYSVTVTASDGTDAADATVSILVTTVAEDVSGQAIHEFQIVRIYFEDEATGALLAASLEPIVTDYDRKQLVVEVTPEQLDELRRRGLRVAVVSPEDLERIVSPPERIVSPPRGKPIEELPAISKSVRRRIPGYSCYRTVEETFASAEAIVEKFPDLASWSDIGDSWLKSEGSGGYDMNVLVLTNSQVPGPKPTFLGLSSIHAREYTPAELMTRFAEHLTDNYGLDADATWLLDHHEIHLVLQGNPDGRKVAESGILWRKSRSQNSCVVDVFQRTARGRGTDLNRNFDFAWDCCGGSSDNPCLPTFNGGSPASEPEVRAIQDYMRQIFRDQRGAGLSDAAPEDTTGVMLDVHSSGELILFPYGFARRAANHDELQTLARKLAFFNDYRPMKAQGLYMTDGTTRDFSYGVLGVAAFTYELGTRYFEGCSEFNDTVVSENLPSLYYAAKVARAPYITPSGPDVVRGTLSLGAGEWPNAVRSGTTVALSATLTDRQFQNSNGVESVQDVSAAEYYIDVPPWSSDPSPVAIPMTSQGEGRYRANLNTSGLSMGRHIVFVRGKDTTQTWGAVSAILLGIVPSSDATLSRLSLSGIDIGTFSGTTTAYMASVANSVTATTVTATANHSGATVAIDPGSDVALAEGENTIMVTVTAEDGTTTRTYAATVTRAALPIAAITAGATPVAEGAAASFTVTLDQAAPEALAVAVQVTETGSALSGTPPASVSFAKGSTSATLSVPSDEDSVVEADSTMTATVIAGTGYTVGSDASASVTVEDNDAATFTVSANAEAIREGQTVTLTLAISNAVTFAEDQAITLALSGTASEADYTGVPPMLMLAAGASSVTTTLEAKADQQEEEAETLTVTASLGESPIGSATVTITSVSQDATLADLDLSGIDIGTFSGAVSTYQATVSHSVGTTTVTATANHSAATVSIEPGHEVGLDKGANRIAVTVTAEDGATTKTYTVTVTRAELPVVSIVAVEERVAGPIGAFRLTRTGSTAEALEVQVLVTDTRSQRATPMTVRFRAGQASKTHKIQGGNNRLVEDDIGVTSTLQEGAGYALSAEQASASLVLEESDVPAFAVSVEPAEIVEGAAATVTVEITNGVRFQQDQTIDLSLSGTASGSDYTGVPATLRLREFQTTTTAATLIAEVDEEEESEETVTITASHGGSEIGSATVMIAASEAAAPLTAQFAGTPARHDGETAFRFELRFSEETAISYRTLRDTAFEVTGGSVTRARRMKRPSNLRWEITVEPMSDADVVLALPSTTDCSAEGAVCTAGGKGLSQRVTATVEGPSEVETAGFPLARENSRPSGIWSDGETAWVADLDDARLYAYRRSDGERQPGKDIATEAAPMGLWSDGETLWVAGLGGGLRAHRLADGSRLAGRDLPLEANAAPAGLWSDGETAWVSSWLGDTVHAYRLSDGRRVADREIKLDGGNLMPVGLWSNGETLWVADWRERLHAYRLADGRREPQLDITVGAADTDPTGLWSGGGTLLSTSWEDREVRAYRVPVVGDAPAAEVGAANRDGWPGIVPLIGDPGLRAAIREALGKESGEPVSAGELAGLGSLSARNRGIRDLTGIEAATGLKALDLGFNPLADLRPLAGLPALESVNLDGAALDLGPLAVLTGLRRLSVRHNLIDDLRALAALSALTELDVGDNRIEDLGPLAALGRLAVLRADRNRIGDLWPLAGLTGLQVLELGANRVRDLQPLAGLERLESLQLAGNGLAELHSLSGLKRLTSLGLAGNAIKNLGPIAGLDGLQRLDLRGNFVGDLWSLRGLSSLAWVHIGGSRIKDLAPLDGLDRLTVAGRDDLEPPSAGGGPLQ